MSSTSLSIRTVAISIVMLLFVVACTSGADVAEPEASSTTSTMSTTSTTTTEVVNTTVVTVPAPEFSSPGEIIIGEDTWEFVFECYAAGAGDVLALGLGSETDGAQTQAVVQAFLGAAYVAVLIGEDRVLELAIDRPAELFVQGNLIRGSALRFVDADGASGVGESLGLGTVHIDCDSFAPGLPEGYQTS